MPANFIPFEFARSAGESLHPGLWKGKIGDWVPELGNTGLILRDVSTHKLDGTLTNVTLANVWTVRNGRNTIFYSEGSSNYCALPPRAMDGISTAFTVVASNVTRNSFTQDQGIWSYLVQTSGSWRHSLEIEDTDTIRMRLQRETTGAHPDWISTSTILDDSEHQIAFAWENVGGVVGDGALYLDGIEESVTFNVDGYDSSFTMQVPAAGPHSIARVEADPPGRHYDGSIGRLTLWNRKLTSNEVRLLWAMPFIDLMPLDELGFVAAVVPGVPGGAYYQQYLRTIIRV